MKIYFDFFGHDESSWIACEICGARATDIHHIVARGMGGSKNRDIIENLMACCRICHEKFGDKKEHRPYLTMVHMENVEKQNLKPV